MSKKYDYAFVKDTIELAGYKLLTSSYKNAHSKLKTMCPNGHIYYVSFGKWLLGRRCLCESGKLRIIEDDIKKLCVDKNLVFVEVVKHNYRKYVRYVCENGHINEVRLDHFKNGCGCAQCAGNKN